MSVLNSFKSNKLFWQITLILFLITSFSFIFTFSFFLVTEQTNGKGSAINVSGSLRMQSYVTALTVAQSATMPKEQREEVIHKELAEFERRLLSPGLTDGIPHDLDDPLRKSYIDIYNAFFHSVEPMAQEVILDPDHIQLFLTRIHFFVQKIDLFVAELEQDLEERMNFLKTGLLATMLIAVLLGAGLLYYFQKVLFTPLRELSLIASEVRRGNFNQRSTYKEKNEIGQLSDNMNFMIQDLSRMYGSLEQQVREKTADLDQRNRSLNLLYQLKESLGVAELHSIDLRQALNLVNKNLGSFCSAIYLHSGSTDSLRLSAFSLLGEEQGMSVITQKILNQHIDLTKNACFSSEFEGHDCRFCLIPLISVEGNLLVAFNSFEGTRADRHLLRSIAQNFADAINNAQKTEEGFKLALYEERSTIARELHDSIAQSLAFSKIQLSRLTASLKGGQSNEEIDAIIQELKEGVTTAYKQLREVLTTFRLKPESADIRKTIWEILEDFSNRSGIRYELKNHLLGYELNPNAQIHLLQILREALVNVEKHAHADFVSIVIAPDGSNKMKLEITDNGVGFKKQQKHGHFGLNIMQERAKAMDGEIAYENITPHGARVILKFNLSSGKEINP